VTATPPPAAGKPQDIKQVIEVLADAIRTKNDPMRMKMWFRVREQGAAAVPALLEAFDKYPEPDVKEYMVKCLSWTKDERAWDFVKARMKSPDVAMRRRATYEINNFDDHRATPLLVEALKDPDERVRVHACIALGVLDDKKAIEPLKATYKSDASDLVRQFAKKQLELYEINYPEAKVK
jgi:HEAT repeat protein